MIQDILETKIVEASLGTKGDDLFRNFMPSELKSGVMTRIPLEGISEDSNMPGWFKGRIQAIVRHHDPDEGERLARQVRKTLTIRGRSIYPANQEREGVIISFFIPETLPIEFPRLEGNGYEWSIHFKTAFFGDL